jgi:hypothetical protein
MSAHPPSATISSPRCARVRGIAAETLILERRGPCAPLFTVHVYVTCDHAPPTRVSWGVHATPTLATQHLDPKAGDPTGRTYHACAAMHGCTSTVVYGM